MPEVQFIGVERPKVQLGSPVFRFKCDCGKEHFIKVDIMNIQINVSLGTAASKQAKTPMDDKRLPKFEARTVA